MDQPALQPRLSRHTIPLGRILGIAVDLDYSWFLIFALLTWILAVNYYPAQLKSGRPMEFWLLGASTALLLFVSVLLHEFGHSLVARRFGISVPRITLFIFGGVSQLATEPTSAGAEFWMALAGPGVSFSLALLFRLLQRLLTSLPLLALAKYLVLINIMLGLFNLIPGFPLDGGRIFRAILWRAYGNFRRATLIASSTGRFFGFLFIALGVWMALSGNVLNGIWIAFIGWFLESAAVAQVQQQLVQGLLVGHKVSEAMSRDVVSISPTETIESLVHDHVLGAGRTSFVVSGDSGFAGLLTLDAMRHFPREVWPSTTAQQAMIPAGRVPATSPSAELSSALEGIGRNGFDQLPVLEQGRIVGMLSRNDVVHYLGILHALRA